MRADGRTTRIRACGIALDGRVSFESRGTIPDRLSERACGESASAAERSRHRRHPVGADVRIRTGAPLFSCSNFLLECVARASRGGLTAADIHLYANPHRTNIKEVRIPSDRLGHRPVDTPTARRATTIPVLRR
nr:hypothetical protein [Burkholderia pseudomallei]